MTTMFSEMQQWVNEHYSVSCQNDTVCDKFPSSARILMIAASDDSTLELKEVGMPIKRDFTLGEPRKGTRTHVTVTRPRGTIGIFHTHPYGFAQPSGRDLMEALARNDKVSCIGATGYIGTKVACYVPTEPEWTEWRFKVEQLVEDIKAFNEIMRETYLNEDETSEHYGKPLWGRELREAMSFEHYALRTALEKKGRALTREVERAFPVEDCKIIWETIERAPDEMPIWFKRLTDFFEEKKR